MIIIGCSICLSRDPGMFSLISVKIGQIHNGSVSAQRLVYLVCLVYFFTEIPISKFG